MSGIFPSGRLPKGGGSDRQAAAMQLQEVLHRVVDERPLGFARLDASADEAPVAEVLLRVAEGGLGDALALRVKGHALLSP